MKTPQSTTRRPLTASRGFSLIELMVVVLILAFAAAGVRTIINPNGSLSKQMNQQGETLFAQMQFALDEALFTLNPLGLVIKQDPETGLMSTQYQWYSYNGDEWVERKKTLVGGELDKAFAWQVNVEEEPLEETLDDLLEEDEDTIKPQIAFYPSGEVTPFDIEIGLSEELLFDNPNGGQMRYKIAVNERGALQRFLVGEDES